MIDISKLSLVEAAKLRTQLDVLYPVSSSSKSSAVDLHRAVTRVFQEDGIGNVPRPAQLKKTKHALEQAAVAIESMQEKITVKGRSRVAPKITCVRITIAYLRDIGVPVTYRTVVQNLARIDEVFEECFPSYAQNNLLRWILKK